MDETKAKTEQSESEDYPGKPLPDLPFGVVKNRIMCGDVWVATCRSHTMAKRIARLLTKYPPNRKGE